MLRTPRARVYLLLAAASLAASSESGAAAPTPALPEAGETASTALAISHVGKHPGARPIVVVVAQSKAVLSDFVVPYGVLAQSGAARVIAVNMVDGPLAAGPLTLVPDMTAAAFDRAYPEGADYVIVPATADRHAEELAWLQAQHARGAALVSICDGVELLEEAGLLDGRQATGHWASFRSRRKHFPKVTWLTNTRYVANGDVASSAGVSAALPISLAPVETIAGPQVTRATADCLGVASWSAVHDSDPFGVRRTDIAVHKANMRARQEDVAIRVGAGEDEVALALTAEPWSRTMRDQVHLVSETAGPVRLRGGLQVQAEAASGASPDVTVVLSGAAPAGTALPAALDAIAQRYGSGTARLSALGMEYPWGDLKAPQ